MINPILERELKSRVRNWKAPMAIFAYLVIIGLVTYIGTTIIVSRSNQYGIDPRGATMSYDAIIIIQMIVIMFIVPMFTATSISSERERQTLDLMLCANFSPWRIIFGKIGSAMLFVMLLIILAVPFMSVIFMFGGMTPLDFLKVILYYGATAFMLSTIGMYTSARYKKNLVSIVMTYVIMAILYILPIMLFILLMIQAPTWMEDLMLTQGYLVMSIFFGVNPGFGLLSLLTNDFFGLAWFVNNSIILTSIPSWLISMCYFVIISVVMLLLAYRQLVKGQS